MATVIESFLEIPGNREPQVPHYTMDHGSRNYSLRMEGHLHQPQWTVKPGETQAWGDIQVKKYRRPGFAGRAGGAGRNSRQAAQPDRPSRRRPEVVRRFSADLRNRTGRLARPLRRTCSWRPIRTPAADSLTRPAGQGRRLDERAARSVTNFACSGAASPCRTTSRTLAMSPATKAVASSQRPGNVVLR